MIKTVALIIFVLIIIGIPSLLIWSLNIKYYCKKCNGSLYIVKIYDQKLGEEKYIFKCDKCGEEYEMYDIIYPKEKENE